MIAALTRRAARLACAALVAFAAGCASCGGGGGDDSSAGGGAPPTRPAATPTPTSAPSAVPGVGNFGVVSPDVWRGARPTPEGLRALAARGVRTIVDLQEVDESADVPAGVRYVPIRVSAWHADRVDTAAVLRAIRDNPKPVYVHCREGRDRTGLAVAAYRLSCGATVDAALAELDRYDVHFWWRGPIEQRLRQLDRDRSPAPATRP